MNSFDLDIVAVNIPSNLGMSTGSETMRELAVMQEGTEGNHLRLMRSLSDPREFFRRLGERLLNRGAHSSSFMAVGSKPWITVA